MLGREDKKANDLFFTCSLIEYIARKTKNKPSDIVVALGTQNIQKIYDLADVYHCDNIDDVSDSFIESCNIKKGDFDNVAECKYTIQIRRISACERIRQSAPETYTHLPANVQSGTGNGKKKLLPGSTLSPQSTYPESRTFLELF